MDSAKSISLFNHARRERILKFKEQKPIDIHFNEYFDFYTLSNTPCFEYWVLKDDTFFIPVLLEEWNGPRSYRISRIMALVVHQNLLNKFIQESFEADDRFVNLQGYRYTLERCVKHLSYVDIDPVDMTFNKPSLKFKPNKRSLKKRKFRFSLDIKYDEEY